MHQTTKKKKSVLTIAGFDGSGGAGIQADIKTITALHGYATSVLTALPVQNTTGVRNCYALPALSIEEQLYTIFEDIQPQAIKIGMLFNSQVIGIVSDFLKKNAQNIPIVVDPVMVANSGDTLLEAEAIALLTESILPLATIITPNIPEAKVLTQQVINHQEDMIQVAKSLYNLLPGVAIYLKGGHLNFNDMATDLLVFQDKITWLEKPFLATKNTHGTGCTLSAAMAIFLAQGQTITTACKQAKDYLQKALTSGSQYTIGKGAGPLDHFFHLTKN